MFEEFDVLGIYRNNNMMKVCPGLQEEGGTLMGIMFIWPTHLQPVKVEWAAVVKFLVKDPQQMYFVCDIVHAHLMEIVAITKRTYPLSTDKTIPTKELLHQATNAHTILSDIARDNNLEMATEATLGVTLTGSNRVSRMNHFYALEGEKPNPLLAAARKYDPSLA